MRVNANDRTARSAIKEVRLDGLKVPYVLMADDVAGVIEYHKTNDMGQLQVVDGEVAVGTAQGRVEIIFNHGWGVNKDDDYVFTYGGKGMTVRNPSKLLKE